MWHEYENISWAWISQYFLSIPISCYPLGPLPMTPLALSGKDTCLKIGWLRRSQGSYLIQEIFVKKLLGLLFLDILVGAACWTAVDSVETGVRSYYATSRSSWWWSRHWSSDGDGADGRHISRASHSRLNIDYEQLITSLFIGLVILFMGQNLAVVTLTFPGKCILLNSASIAAIVSWTRKCHATQWPAGRFFFPSPLTTLGHQINIITKIRSCCVDNIGGKSQRVI